MRKQARQYNERRPGQGNSAQNGREPVRSILSRNFFRICIGVTGVFGVVIALATVNDTNIVLICSYSGLLVGLAVGNISGEL